MSDVLICPDCGGVIGATEATEHGHPCRCLLPQSRANEPAPRAKAVQEEVPAFDDLLEKAGLDREAAEAESAGLYDESAVPSMDPNLVNPVSMEANAGISSPPDGLTGEETGGIEPGEPKICVLCGKDTRGHRRLKDSRGYICYECAKEERRKERGDRVRCGQCEKMLKPEVMTPYEGLRLCPACFKERSKAQSTVIKRIGIKSAYERTEKERILIMVGVAVFLLLLPLIYKLLFKR